METTNQATLDEALSKWEAEYKPIKNHLVPDSSWNGTMFETYGDEVDFVINQDDHNTWTWVDGDDGTYLVSGYHLVNRIGYFITEKAWDDMEEFQVDFSGETCDECGAPTDNGAGHWMEELGEDHPRAEERLCKECYLAIERKEC